MSKKHPKYPHQRVEQRAVSIDLKGEAEAKKMKDEVEKISIGTFHIFGVNPEDTIQTFTVAFTKEVSKSKLYLELDKAFSENWSPTTKSELIHLSEPLSLKAIRRIIRESYKRALSQN